MARPWLLSMAAIPPFSPKKTIPENILQIISREAREIGSLPVVVWDRGVIREVELFRDGAMQGSICMASRGGWAVWRGPKKVVVIKATKAAVKAAVEGW